MFIKAIKSTLFILMLAGPAKADVIGAPILVVQAIGSIITFFASQSEYQPQHLLTVENSEIQIDSQALKKKIPLIEEYLFYQCQNWNEKKVIAQSELKLIEDSLNSLKSLEQADEVFTSKLHTAIFLFAVNDFSNTHVRKSSFGGPFKKSQWSSSEFKKQLSHKGCEDFHAYYQVKAWSDSMGYPFFK